ncbi:POK8 protein, partial [Crypturellus soui]|nr:POK8 protein [Crypturellus soui]
MGALQPGLPTPAMLPQGWNLLVIDLKDCFYTIPLHPEDSIRHGPLSRFESARVAHEQFHTNAKGLMRLYDITISDARGVVQACPQCSHHGPGLG